MAAPDVVVEAARVVVVDGIAHAEGPVRITVGDDVVTGAAATLDADRRHATVVDGTWSRAGVGVLTFAEATVDLVDATGTASGASFVGAGGFAATGDTLALQADGTLIGDHVVLTVCDCDGVKPWSVTARHVAFDPGASVRFRGGVVRVLDVPVLPVPAGDVPLARRSGLLAPALAYGEDGLIAAVPLYLTLGPSADLTLTPEIRTGRTTQPADAPAIRTSPTARLVIEQRYALAAARGTSTIAAGWDENTSSWRGGVDADHRLGDGTVGAAMSGRLTSDPLVSADYGDRFLARQQPWNEARGLAWIGPVEARVDGIQAPTAAMQDAGLAVRTGGMRLPGGAIAAATATADVRGVVRADDSAVALVGTVDGFADRPTLAGPLRVTPGVFATAGARQPLGADPAAPAAFAEAGAHADVGLPAWRATATAFERLEPGVDVRWTPVRAAEQPAIGVVPYLSWEHGGSTDAGARIAWDAGLTWTGYATRHGATAWAQGSTSGLYLGPSAAGFAAHHGALDLGASCDLRAVRRDPPARPVDPEGARSDAARRRTDPPRPAQQRADRGSAAWDLAGGQLLSRTATVRWTHASGCLAIGATARFDRDRAVPDVAIAIDPWPNR